MGHSLDPMNSLKRSSEILGLKEFPEAPINIPAPAGLSNQTELVEGPSQTCRPVRAQTLGDSYNASNQQ